jgi:hypothetical protein
VRNGLAVVYRRGASAGSFFTIPHKHKLLQEKKIIIDEHSGRILVDSMLMKKRKMENLFSKF